MSDRMLEDLRAAMADEGLWGFPESLSEKFVTEHGPALLAMLEAEDSPTWPHVLAFARVMEQKLSENRHKGDAEGWRKMSESWLLAHALEECAEVEAALLCDAPNGAVTRECADAANFLMMVSDTHRARTRREGRGEAATGAEGREG